MIGKQLVISEVYEITVKGNVLAAKRNKLYASEEYGITVVVNEQVRRQQRSLI